MSIDFAVEPERERFSAREIRSVRDRPWGVFASVGLHALLIALIPLLAVGRVLVPPSPLPVEIELISAADFDATIAPPEAPVLAAPQPAAEPAETAPPPENGPIEATQFFAGKVLAEDKRIAAALPTLGNDERVIQLCNIEALEQIKSAKPEFAPDTLVAYAFGDMTVAAGILTAPGGAFRSRRKWWNVSVKCAVAPDYSAVTAFEFTLGDEVPHEEWEAHYLTEEDAEE
jgi:hypothetical protein